MLFIGSSHVHHLRESMYFDEWKSHIAPAAVDFLSASEYVGVGGLKWWTLENEIHGIFTNPAKFHKYGDQWSQYRQTGHCPEAAILINGSNDVDDYNNCTLSAPPNGIYDIDFNDCATAIMEKWLSQLKPVIVSAITHVRDILPMNTKLFYLPILPRIWWHKKARDMANKLDHFVTVTLRREHNIHINMTSIATLVRYPAISEYDNIYKDVLPAFMETDNTHVNLWGYEAILRDIAPSIMAFKGSGLY